MRDRELLNLCLGGVDGSLGDVDASLGLGDRLRRGRSINTSYWDWAGLLLQRGLSQGRLCIVHGGFGNFTSLPQRPQVFHDGSGFFDGHLGRSIAILCCSVLRCGAATAEPSKEAF